jgi:hypothetical protein
MPTNLVMIRASEFVYCTVLAPLNIFSSYIVCFATHHLQGNQTRVASPHPNAEKHLDSSSFLFLSLIALLLQELLGRFGA